MPELPEVEIVKRSLSQMISRTKIIDIKVNNKNLRYPIHSSFKKELINQKILKISRRSKYLIFYFKEKILLSHLGMTGKFIIIKTNNGKVFKTSFYYDLNVLKKHNHVYFILSNGLTLIYNDVRRFGFLKIYNDIKINKLKFLNKLGVEPFSKNFNINYFLKFIKNKKTSIKSLLMNQNFISGLGNIYVNEVLFMSKIKPFKVCNILQKNEIKILILNIKKILKLSISKGGSSINDFNNTFGKKGTFQQYFYVYGRKGEKCSRISCNGKIKKVLISNRSSFYCENCQN
jgi:formamidopyrimidine-DNA glycosylase